MPLFSGRPVAPTLAPPWSENPALRCPDERGFLRLGGRVFTRAGRYSGFRAMTRVGLQVWLITRINPPAIRRFLVTSGPVCFPGCRANSETLVEGRKDVDPRAQGVRPTMTHKRSSE